MHLFFCQFKIRPSYPDSQLNQHVGFVTESIVTRSQFAMSVLAVPNPIFCLTALKGSVDIFVVRTCRVCHNYSKSVFCLIASLSRSVYSLLPLTNIDKLVQLTIDASCISFQIVCITNVFVKSCVFYQRDNVCVQNALPSLLCTVFV